MSSCWRSYFLLWTLWRTPKAMRPSEAMENEGSSSSMVRTGLSSCCAGATPEKKRQEGVKRAQRRSAQKKTRRSEEGGGGGGGKGERKKKKEGLKSPATTDCWRVRVDHGLGWAAV